ncbi:MAG: hypothetical protein KJP21_01520, partial [Bacteroidia bacterium]|nr:hypothetical protein [Bacteroidia bacterium]
MFNSSTQNSDKLLALHSWCVAAQDSSSQYQDQLIARYMIYAERFGTDKDVFNAYVVKVTKYRLFAQNEQNLALLNQLESFDYVKSHPFAQYFVKQQYALTLHRLGNYAGSIDIYQQQLQNTPKKNKAIRAKLHRLIADVYEDQREYKLAHNQLIASYKLMNSLNFNPGKYLALKDLSSVLVKLGKYDSALLIAQKSDSFFTLKKNIFMATACKRHIAQAYQG